MNDTDARLWHPWLRINRVLRVMLHTHAGAWRRGRKSSSSERSALQSKIRRAAGGSNE